VGNGRLPLPRNWHARRTILWFLSVTAHEGERFNLGNLLQVQFYVVIYSFSYARHHLVLVYLPDLGIGPIDSMRNGLPRLGEQLTALLLLRLILVKLCVVLSLRQGHVLAVVQLVLIFCIWLNRDVQLVLGRKILEALAVSVLGLCLGADSAGAVEGGLFVHSRPFFHL